MNPARREGRSGELNGLGRSAAYRPSLSAVSEPLWSKQKPTFSCRKSLKIAAKKAGITKLQAGITTHCIVKICFRVHSAERWPMHPLAAPCGRACGIKIVSDGTYLHDPVWYRNVRYEEESRGLDDIEDLGSPDYALGLFRVSFSDWVPNLCRNNNTSYVERETGEIGCCNSRRVLVGVRQHPCAP